MPVDLSAAGLPSRYPTHKPRFVPWLFAWLLCGVIGAGLIVLLWPSSTPAQGAWFWFCVLGLPSMVFCMVLGLALTQYETRHAHALHRNWHRDDWLRKRVRFAQQPLQVLGTNYCLPFDEPRLCVALAGTEPLMRMQLSRGGSGRVMHGRFADDDLRLNTLDDSINARADALLVAADGRSAGQTGPDARVVALLENTLAPLATMLHELSQQGSARAPAVRVVAETGVAKLRQAEVRMALRRVGLPALECLVLPDANGLMTIDAWLDSGDRRPLLIVVASWNDMPSPGSTEGAVAVLLASMHARLPESVHPVGVVHRPVDGAAKALGDVLANALLWGDADSEAVKQAWIGSTQGVAATDLVAALERASLAGIKQSATQRHLDALIGDAGAVRPWLALVAAIESGAAGPQLLLDAAHSVQAALLHVHPSQCDDLIHD
jgi:hypothetical protein